MIFTLPMVLPPTVCGYLLLLIFGAGHPVGRWLSGLGVQVAMHWYGGVLAAAVVAFPLMYRTARGAFESFDPALERAAQTLGLSNTYIFWRIHAGLPAGDLGGAVLTAQSAGRVRGDQHADRVYSRKDGDCFHDSVSALADKR